jgi:hypothetical protein
MGGERTIIADSCPLCQQGDIALAYHEEKEFYFGFCIECDSCWVLPVEHAVRAEIPSGAPCRSVSFEEAVRAGLESMIRRVTFRYQVTGNRWEDNLEPDPNLSPFAATFDKFFRKILGGPSRPEDEIACPRCGIPGAWIAQGFEWVWPRIELRKTSAYVQFNCSICAIEVCIDGLMPVPEWLPPKPVQGRRIARQDLPPSTSDA